MANGMNEFPCGCKTNGFMIEYCPKHKAAPALYGALKGLLHDYSTNPTSDIFFEACRKARQALALAGKQ